MAKLPWVVIAGALSAFGLGTSLAAQQAKTDGIGRENAVPRHLQAGDELRMPLPDLLAFGRTLFEANWTEEDGAGRPQSTGAGRPLTNPANPLTGSRAFNRISGPYANSCQGCHNLPHGWSGGGGDFVTAVWSGAEAQDFVGFDRNTAASAGQVRSPRSDATLQTVGRQRATPGLFGAGYIEMLARQMTADLRVLRDAVPLGGTKALSTKGVSFGVLARRADGTWDASKVEGLPAVSTRSAAGAPPTLEIRPWTQSGDWASLRSLTVDMLNRSHGMQATERFGVGTDPDRDGVKNEITRADVTALVLFQASMPVPGQVIPRDPQVAQAIALGEQAFARAKCTTCHLPSLPLSHGGWVFTEPAASATATAGARSVLLDLTDGALPTPRLAAPSKPGRPVDVPALTDLKLHDVSGTGERFLTRRLWGIANEPPFWHDGSLTTLRSAVLAHKGEATPSRVAFEQLPQSDQDALIEFLKSLQVLPPGTQARIVDELYRPR